MKSTTPASAAARSAQQAITVVRPNQRHEMGFLRTWVVMAGNVWRTRQLIWQLFRRDFVGAYKKSFLGMTWVFLSPLVGILSWVFLQMTGMLRPGELDIPYPVYVLIGSSMWGLFMGFLGAARGTLGAGGGLLRQINYPHEALMFKQVASFLANYLVKFLMNIVVLCAFRVYPSWGVLLLPLVALPLFFLGAAIGLMIALISVVSVDLNRVVTFVLRFLIWTTPLIYSNKVGNPLVQKMIKYNPLTYLVCSCRDMVIYGRFYEGQFGVYLVCAAVSLLAFLVVWRLFYVSEHKLIERMM